jgi:hypothetical protein
MGWLGLFTYAHDVYAQLSYLVGYVCDEDSGAMHRARAFPRCQGCGLRKTLWDHSCLDNVPAYIFNGRMAVWDASPIGEAHVQSFALLNKSIRN